MIESTVNEWYVNASLERINLVGHSYGKRKLYLLLKIQQCQYFFS